jgi:hypothetical protein
MKCLSCDAETTETMEAQNFQYGCGFEAVELTALVPLIRCIECGFEFTDFRGEEARDKAVFDYLKSLRGWC